MPTPRSAPADLTARRQLLLALHRRYAGLVRAMFYWFGADLEIIDAAVQRTLLLATRSDPAATPPSLAHIALITWRVVNRPERPSHNELDPEPAIPRLPPAADLLARLLAVHAAAPTQRAAFVLTELGAMPLPAVATALGRDPDTLRHELTHLRHRIVEDREVIALGGPRSLLLASLAPFVHDPSWHRRNAAQLLARLPCPPPTLSEQLRRPPAILALGLAAVALLLLLRPSSPIARPHAIPSPVIVAHPIAPPPRVAPAPQPVPPATSPEPAPAVRVARVARQPRTPRPAKPGHLAEREALAKARDPGAIIVELEMLGAGCKSLPSNPRQALAYAEQHARDYPQSQLAHQRSELRVRALCALGRLDEARSETNRAQAQRVHDALRDACKP